MASRLLDVERLGNEVVGGRVSRLCRFHAAGFVVGGDDVAGGVKVPVDGLGASPDASAHDEEQLGGVD